MRLGQLAAFCVLLSACGGDDRPDLGDDAAVPRDSGMDTSVPPEGGTPCGDGTSMPCEVTGLSAGRWHTCATRNDGTLWCWGDNARGQVGDGTMADRTVPTRVGTSSTWEATTGGGNHSCAMRSDGSLWCWGYDPLLGLGSFAMEESVLPTRVGTDTDWARASSGYYHVCATRDDGSLWCWGSNGGGQLGDGGTSTATQTPTRVGTENTWHAVRSGDRHTCAIRTDGTLWCWGNNMYGQAGDGAASHPQLVPARVGSASTWATVATGSEHNCAARDDGTLWCWGNNAHGQFGGGGTSAPSPAPIQVGTETTWAVVTAGDRYTCATRTDGTLWCWGRNEYGQLGDGTTDDRFVPTQVGTEDTWEDVSAGESHTCARRSDGSVWCWGRNSDGQLGDGTTVDRLVPTVSDL